MQVAESTLGELRAIVDGDEGADAEMLKFVMDTSELAAETDVRIIMHETEGFVTYGVVNRGK